VRRRETGEPLEWITGRARFGDLTLAIVPGVYVPRPQSEVLATRAAAVLPARGIALDLCTGCGAVAASMCAAVRGATVVGVDLDPVAVACARRNGVVALVGDLAAPVHAPAAVDVVTAVAPYVPSEARRLLPSDVRRHEPVVALDGGDDGLVVVRRIVAQAAVLLRPGGHLLLELGGTQDAALAPHLTGRGFGAIAVWRDEHDDLRGLAARRAS
jgi:release factor glutamine methyltransferase